MLSQGISTKRKQHKRTDRCQSQCAGIARGSCAGRSASKPGLELAPSTAEGCRTPQLHGNSMKFCTFPETVLPGAAQEVRACRAQLQNSFLILFFHVYIIFIFIFIFILISHLYIIFHFYIHFIFILIFNFYFNFHFYIIFHFYVHFYVHLLYIKLCSFTFLTHPLSLKPRVIHKEESLADFLYVMKN